MGQTPDPASPSPTTSDLEEELADLPGFAPSPTPRGPDPLDPTATTTGTTTGPITEEEWLAGGSSGEDEAEPRRDSETPRIGSSKASTDWRDLVPLTSTLVAMTSLAVRWIRARRRPLAEGVWIADEDDAAAIGAPLARIAARRSPISGEGSADMIDGLEVLVGSTGYVMKNLEREAEGAAYLDTVE